MFSLHESARLPSNPTALARLERLREASARPEGLEFLREEILRGTIRVAPSGRGDLKILPTSLLGRTYPPSRA